MLEQLSGRIALIETRLKEKAETDEKVRLLRTHTGVGLLSALATMHTLGDVSRFASSKQAVAFAGLDPLERSSAGKAKPGSISKAGSPLLRELLGHAMHAAVRFDPELKAFYKRLARRRSKPIAKVAATRKLLIRLFIMLRDAHRLRGVQKARLRQPECPQCLKVRNVRFLIGPPACFYESSAKQTSWAYGRSQRSRLSCPNR